ncbi:MAG TPA: pyridoxamine 5'-phosphate oxidase family protein [Candidatus Binataceae bacterium]|nr:pyridoxamine 5'-phosphate oxidase family protein [Candidatus Binataceae bacterium]
MEAVTPTERTRLRRLPKRAAYERVTINSILDEALICHIGFVQDGQPFTIPTLHVRQDDQLYVHGSAASRMLKTASDTMPICVTVTLIDGLVLARSAFHHSVNYRSVVILGTAVRVDDREAKVGMLRAMVEKLVPYRWQNTRPPTDQELAATMVLRLPIEEASAKVRVGQAMDDEGDYALPHWAGVIPLHLRAGTPIPDPRMTADIATPMHVLDFARNSPAVRNGTK